MQKTLRGGFSMECFWRVTEEGVICMRGVGGCFFAHAKNNSGVFSHNAKTHPGVVFAWGVILARYTGPHHLTAVLG